ncbi:GDSL-type esterase/lipase family protein [Robertmurraya massiliosenegalensis]|uniref:GDSL-type esterase/lipase family protein n=1 Tax=Robertmurraya TaxID=2837507 RepID=UPI0039A58C47
MKKYFFLMIFMTIVFGICSRSFSENRELKIVAFGDSITYGTGDPLQQGYVGRLVEKLEEKIPSVYVKNYGVPKYTTEDILRILRKRQALKSIRQANYITLFIGTNDFRQSVNYQFNRLPKEKLERGKRRYLANLHKTLEVIRANNPHAPMIVMGLYHPYVEYDNQKEIFDTIEDWNIEVNTVTQDFQQTYFLPTADLFLIHEKKQCFSDSLHPNAYGYDLLSNRVSEKIMTLEL